jgi:hypothetical protein
VGTGGGLARLQGSTWEVFTKANSALPADHVRALATGGDGALWVATDDGLARLQGGAWEVFTKANSDLPGYSVWALATGGDGALWVATDDGLARLQGSAWEVFTKANSDLPVDRVSALATDGDGALWVGTDDGGLARFRWLPGSPRIEKILAPTTIRQRENTFAARAYDPTYRSDLQRFRYEWAVEKKGLLRSQLISATATRSPYYTASFPEDGAYTVKVTARDQYGRRSEPALFEVMIEVPKPEPWLERLKWAGNAIGGVSLLYLIALWPLLLLYPYAGWARSAVNSGALTKFPILHKILLSSQWSRRRLFKLYVEKALEVKELDYYIPQAARPAGSSEPLPLARAEDPLSVLKAQGRYLLVLGRSGTGKSVLLSRFHRLEAARFRTGKTTNLPVLLNALTHLGNKSSLTGAIRDALCRDGKVELPDEALDFLIRKGGFLILIDGLNEMPGSGAADALNPFLNRDASNTVLMASQTDVLHRQDVAVFAMVEVSPEEAAAYLTTAIGPGAWDSLSPELQALARNPQDLALIAEVASHLKPESMPNRRAALYAEKIKDDSALREWIKTADPRLNVIYSLAFRMLAEQRVLDEQTLAEWVRMALEAQELDPQEVGVVMAAVRRSRLFREIIALDRLGRSQPMLTFDHELTGAFLAARHVRTSLKGSEHESILEFADQEPWQNVFFFVVDELSPALLPGMLLDDLLARGSDMSLRIAAYAIESKKEEAPPLPGRIQAAYTTAKLHQDLRATPSAA